MSAVRGDFAVGLAVAFGLGVLVCVVAQERADASARAALREEIRQCNGKGWDMVLRANAAPMCVAMMPRFEIIAPLQPDPLRLTPKEVRRAAH